MFWIALVGGYVLTSVLLLKFPTILHKKKDIRFRAVHISHRGGAGENLENTLTAFRHAAEVGTQMLEVDCHITRDGEVVVCHDEDLYRLTGHSVLVQDVLYKDLPPLMGSLRLDFQHCHVVHGSEDRHIPLLREVYEQFPGMPVNIDIKVDNDELIRKVSELTVEFDREHLTVWGNRSSEVVEKCYRQNPNMPILFSMSRVIQLLVFFYTGLLPFVPMKESFYEIVMPSIIMKPGQNGTSREISTKDRLFYKVLDMLLMNSTMFNHLSARGIQIYIWVLNDEEDFERALSYGATGIMTDFPTRLKHFLERRNAPRNCHSH